MALASTSDWAAGCSGISVSRTTEVWRVDTSAKASSTMARPADIPAGALEYQAGTSADSRVPA